MASQQLRCCLGAQGSSGLYVKSRQQQQASSSRARAAVTRASRSQCFLLGRSNVRSAVLGSLPVRRLRCSAATDEAAAGQTPAQPTPTAEVPVANSIQQIREARLQPLKVALQDAIALHTKATGVREALEAEVCALFERAINAEGSDVDLDEVAAAAMAAVESAVKDEVEAATVVSATQKVLATTLKDLQAISGQPVEEAVAEITAVLASTEGSAAALASMDGAKAAKGSSGSPSVDAIQLLDSLTGSGAGVLAAVEKGSVSSNGTPGSSAAPSTGPSPAPSPPPGTPPAYASMDGSSAKSKQAAAKARLLKAAGFAVAAALAVAFMKSAAGEALVAAANGVVSSIADKIGPIHINPAEQGLLETIWLLLTSIVCVPAVCKFIPGGSPVLGYLIGGALVGPHALNIISDVHAVQHLAELGVVFLLFNIGLELSLERLQSMAKYVFGMGAAQVVFTLLGVALFATNLAGLPGSSAIILGGALAMSTTAVAIQVLEDRGEMGSRHGRATFSVLLFQDLAVVVLLMLIPLLAPDPTGASGGMAKIASALGFAFLKAVIAIVGITVGGRMFIRPLYKKISNLANAEIFAATTLLVVLGTSFMTQLAGLSLALGAFLAGLLIAETEYALQVESDIAPYKGLLMGLFFMTVGMNISAQLFAVKWKMIISAMVVLIAGKLAVMMAAGQMFGVSRVASLRAGLLLSTGGEFAFVAFGEAVSKGVLPAALTSELYMVVALSMAVVPYLAALGGKLGGLFEKGDIKTLQPQEDEVKELRNHVIIAGYGRVGQIIAQMLSELLIPFVALDVRSDRVGSGKASDLPVYFGDAGSPAVLHQVGAERAACAVVTLDTPGANYRTVWAMHKHFPEIKTYVRAHDINHGINLEKAGATVVVPETLEPSMQLAANVLSQFKLPPEEINTHLDNFRKKHLGELQALAALSGTSIGYLAPRPEKKEEAPAPAVDVEGKTVATEPMPSPTPA